MLIQIAWRNIWRNKKRSAVILAAIAFGIWAGVFSIGLMEGAYVQMVEAAVSTRLAHLQIHVPEFRERPDITKTIPDGMAVLEELRQRRAVRSAAGRAVVSGMASSPETAAGVRILGIDPSADARVFDVKDHVREGDWFATKKRNPIVVGSKLQEKLDVGLGNKVVLQAQDGDGTIAAGAFRIVGIFKTASSSFDEMCVFARRQDLQRIFAIGGSLHEIAILLNDVEELRETQSALREVYPDLAVETWQEISPELAVTAEMGDQMLYIFLVIILIALVFGITNTMLMGVLERIRELGVLKALGLKGSRMFGMILLETVMLALVGGATGITLGFGTIAGFARVGIDLSIVSEGLAEFGMGNVVYPTLSWIDYVNVTWLVIVTAIVSAVYPALKAIRLNPVQAIRTY